MDFISFTGEYNYSIDAKGRVNMPAPLRKALPDSSEATVVLTRGQMENIVVYSLDEWKKIQEGLNKLSTINPLHRNFIRSLTRYASICKFDSQGRIAIPPNLLEYAKIKKDVAIIGLNTEIEIWDPELLRFHEQIDFRLDQADFENLANELRRP
ncbi:MAG: division/cell wall cluster transcriptional repressor MraZ [Candidatus Marinimicrobia bacterium CG1_02_48_14]|nr:MAG: division/cell wall cluster transcriptional repressor MraZ [Candidatus Marinimicrobia bacterium CG1_02_48_14]PJA51399.1 MAG: division/cell wall cluster transcriptional repressor MraZ [Candidatus Marinimicrobia bacterium CG_4_9_14_3_um_filter_48_9]